jgi:pimeloyl-ACP methyl ester carboxylesterase
MPRHHIDVDVTGAEGVDLDGPLHTAVTVCLPEPAGDAVDVLFGFPGGGYGRGYYDVTAAPGYSQAEHHCARGAVFVACDHLGVGASSEPDPFDLTYENLAAANHATATRVLEGLAKGTLIDGVAPIEVRATVGMGQSMGGCLLTVQQANHRTFEGVAFLGWSGVHTGFPAPDGGRTTFAMPPRGTDLRTAVDQLATGGPSAEQFRYCFHWPEADAALVEPDLASYEPFSGVVRGDATTPWGSPSVPFCAVTMLTEGAVTAEARAIDVPVLIACGERDVVPDPWAEPAAYRSSRYVSVLVVDRMAHMHNFARTRALLWERIDGFARSLRA